MWFHACDQVQNQITARSGYFKTAQSETTGSFLGSYLTCPKKHLRSVVRYQNCGWIFDFVFGNPSYQH
jgi:hypothetical protein